MRKYFFFIVLFYSWLQLLYAQSNETGANLYYSMIIRF